MTWTFLVCSRVLPDRLGPHQRVQQQQLKRRRRLMAIVTSIAQRKRPTPEHPFLRLWTPVQAALRRSNLQHLHPAPAADRGSWSCHQYVERMKELFPVDESDQVVLRNRAQWRLWSYQHKQLHSSKSPAQLQCQQQQCMRIHHQLKTPSHCLLTLLQWGRQHPRAKSSCSPLILRMRQRASASSAMTPSSQSRVSHAATSPCASSARST